jgi:hypothetical protein
MGGPGSGSHDHWWRPARKAAFEDCLSIDANRWMREGALKAGVLSSGSWTWTYRAGGSFKVNYRLDTLDLGRPSVLLWYSWAGQAPGRTESADYRLDLAATRPHFGGLRW